MRFIVLQNPSLRNHIYPRNIYTREFVKDNDNVKRFDITLDRITYISTRFLISFYYTAKKKNVSKNRIHVHEVLSLNVINNLIFKLVRVILHVYGNVYSMLSSKLYFRHGEMERYRITRLVLK